MSDSWLSKTYEYDKLFHFAGSCTIFCFFSMFFYGHLFPPAVITFTIGFVYELFQHILKLDKFSFKDMIANVLGILLGAISLWLH